MKDVKFFMFFKDKDDGQEEVMVYTDCSLDPHLDVKEAVKKNLADNPHISDCHLRITYADGTADNYAPPVNTSTIG